MENKDLYWIWLSLTLGAGCKNSTDIIDICRCDPYMIYDSELYDTISDYKVLTTRQISKIKNKDLTKAEEILDFCHKNGITVITPSSSLYPRILMRIPSCPFVLYMKGKMPDLSDKIAVATVGTRKMTAIGRRCAYEFAYDLAKSGMIITSGMALGIDSVAHRAALDAGGLTIAVLGSGIDVIYPSQNKDLYEEICQKGAVITEFAPGTPPLAHNFPVRNRIVSGLSVGTLVIEAGERSGSLNTARHASEQGRNVFSVPGPNGEYNNKGTNSLLKDGAIPVTEALDIIKYYTERYGNQIKFTHITKRRTLQISSLPQTKPVGKGIGGRASAKSSNGTKNINPAADNANTENDSHEFSRGYSYGDTDGYEESFALPYMECDDTCHDEAAGGDNGNKSSNRRTGSSKGSHQKQASPQKVSHGEMAAWLETRVFSLGEPMKSISYLILEKGELFPEEISESLALPFHSVLTAVSLLELQGIIKKISGGRFALNIHNR